MRVIPQIEIGKVKYNENRNSEVRAGVFKIEVIGYIAYALSSIKPINSNWQFTGRFLVEDSQIEFTNTPEQTLTLEEGQEIPQKHDVKATTKCSSGMKGDVSFQENEVKTTEGRVITRIWSAENKYGMKSSFVQHIFINKKKEKLQFVGDLPQDITLNCNKNIPEKENLQVIGGCNPKIEIKEVIKNQSCTNNYTIERTYESSDICGSFPIVHK